MAILQACFPSFVRDFLKEAIWIYKNAPKCKNKQTNKQQTNPHSRASLTQRSHSSTRTAGSRCPPRRLGTPLAPRSPAPAGRSRLRGRAAPYSGAAASPRPRGPSRGALGCCRQGPAHGVALPGELQAVGRADKSLSARGPPALLHGDRQKGGGRPPPALPRRTGRAERPQPHTAPAKGAPPRGAPRSHRSSPGSAHPASRSPPASRSLSPWRTQPPQRRRRSQHG